MAVSGVSGAGRKVAQNMLLTEVNEGVKAYGVGGHRHVAEMEQEVRAASATKAMVSFTAHLVPMNRGMSATIHATLAKGAGVDDALAALKKQYDDERFAHVMHDIPTTHEVRATNHCRMAVTADRVSGQIIVVSVIDNLVKGASGQAIQNMNIMYGWDEATALAGTAIFP